MNKPRLSVISTLVLAALSFSVYADDPTIYGQYPKNHEPGKTKDRFLTGDYSDTVAGQMNDQIAADNFTLTDSDAILTGVSWWGGSDATSSTSTDNFQSITVRILSNIDDPADSRGNIVYEETVPFAETSPEWVGFGSAIESGWVYQQKITFKNSVELCQDTEYWVSISATNYSPPVDNNGYFWYGADTAADDSMWTATFSNDPFGWDELFGDQGFELKGVNTTLGTVKCPEPTPEPSPTATATATATATSTSTLTPTATSTATSTSTLTPTATSTATSTSTLTPTATSTATATSTLTPTATSTATATATSTLTPTGTIDYTTTPTPTATPVPKVPVPAAVWLFGSGLAGLFAVARRRKSKS